MHTVIALTAASDAVVVLGGVAALARAAYRMVKSFERVVSAVEKVGDRLDRHERRISALETMRGRGRGA